MALAKCYIAKSVLALFLPHLFVAFDTITSAFLLGSTSNLWASRKFPWNEFPLTSVCITGSHGSAHESGFPQAPTFLDVLQTPQFQHFSVLNPELLLTSPLSSWQHHHPGFQTRSQSQPYITQSLNPIAHNRQQILSPEHSH